MGTHPTTTRTLGQTLRDWRIVYGRRHYRHLAAALLGAAPRRLRRLARDYGLVALLLITIAALGVALVQARRPAPPPAAPIVPLAPKAAPILLFVTARPAPTAAPQPTPEPQIVYVDRYIERVVEVPAAPIVEVLPPAPDPPAEPPAAAVIPPAAPPANDLPTARVAPQPTNDASQITVSAESAHQALLACAACWAHPTPQGVRP